MTELRQFRPGDEPALPAEFESAELAQSRDGAPVQVDPAAGGSHRLSRRHRGRQ